MTFHDAYARRTPYELAFPDRGFAEERLDRIRHDAAERGQDAALADPGRFLTLPAVAETLREIRDPRGDAEELQKHGVLLYHAYHFRQAGLPVFLMETHAARYLVESGDGLRSEGDPPEPPEPSGYVQQPRQLFWIRPSEEGPPEPVDGLFWSAPDGRHLSVLVAAGMRDDRPGLSVVPLPALPLEEAGTWLEAGIRESGRDFESTLPGGEMERLYSLEAAGEVLKLLARTFRYVERFPDAVREEAAPEDVDTTPERSSDAAGASESDGRSEEPAPSRLPYRRVTLVEG